MKNLLIVFAILFSGSIIAQQTFTLSGYVLDSKSGENLPNATILLVGTEKSVSTNNFGFYSITVPQSKVTLKVNYVGFETKVVTLDVQASMKFNFDMSVRNVLEKEIIVRGKQRRDENVKTTETGMHQLSVESVKKLPVILGEVDVLKTIQLLPGVKGGGEGSSGFYVRGGGPDQNLILLDDAVVYNTGHLFGFFSVFNGDAVKNITLIKGGMPANYGGRLSSVLDVSMKEGNNKQFKVDGGIGLIASRLSVQGPIVKNKGSFIVSGRRTYATELLKLVQPNNERLQNFGYYFYDFNAKINYKLGEKDRLYASGYFGDDVFQFSNAQNTFKARIPWGNRTATLRWNHLFSDKLFMNTTAVYNRYDFQFGGAQQSFNVKLTSGIRDWNLKTDLDYFAKNGHKFKFGVGTTYHTFQPSTLSGGNDTVELTPVNPVIKYALESAAYILDDFDVNAWWRINAGIRYSSFLQLSPYTLYTKQNGINQDSVVYQSGQVVQNYGGVEPRLNMRFALNSTSSIKTSVSKGYQYIHLVTNNGSTLPTDLWVPSTRIVQPQKVWQYSAGYFRNFLNNMLETSVEVYYKDMYNQLEYKEGYTPNNNNDPEYEFVQGKGWAYGAEFFVNKAKGNWTGWIGYTLSYTKRKFELLNDAQTYFAKYDRRHDISIVNTYELNKRWTFSSVFIFSSGNRVTLPSNLFAINQQLIAQYDVLNNQQLPPYHRLDIGAVYTPKPKKVHKFSSTWAFSIYNVYNQFNPYIIYLDTGGSVSSGIDLKLKQVQIFPIIPSVTWNFKF
jgi:CarboxypepD_reg-like domain/TonB-dependent Receptor Plug Domain